MPHGSGKGDLRLYRAIDFPLKWKLEKIILERSLVDTFIIQHKETYWIFGSYNGNLEIWYSRSPFGPWTPHKRNPVLGLPNGGRPFNYNGNFYRLAHDNERVHVFKIEVLTPYSYKEVEVDIGVENPTKGRNAWNGARSHHLDVQRLSSGKWVGVADGDRIHFGDVISRRVVGCGLIVTAGSVIFVIGWLLGLVKWFIPNRFIPFAHNVKNKNNLFLIWERLKLRVWLNVNPNRFIGKFVISFLLIVSVVIM